MPFKTCFGHINVRGIHGNYTDQITVSKLDVLRAYIRTKHYAVVSVVDHKSTEDLFLDDDRRFRWIGNYCTTKQKRTRGTGLFVSRCYDAEEVRLKSQPQESTLVEVSIKKRTMLFASVYLPNEKSTNHADIRGFAKFLKVLDKESPRWDEIHIAADSNA